jgi:hypothetical protein
MGGPQGISMTCDATLSIGLALTAAGMVVALVFMGLTAFVAVSIVFTKAATLPAEPKGLDLGNNPWSGDAGKEPQAAPCLRQIRTPSSDHELKGVPRKPSKKHCAVLVGNPRLKEGRR